ncbi:hypothetical protein G4B88_021595 [Cannabis sativa]|uniref:Uncharacterized protein n=1 Tax=Cannabis sativa TaxID=3483 RepID=A0A7J6GIV5_CANSA|nr:hypothetical protein G4B88_021595 [Cannabis sativa]
MEILKTVIDVEEEASAEDLNMPSNSEIRGCCLEGKLLDRTWDKPYLTIYVGMASTPAHCKQGRGSDQPIRIYIAPRETRDIWYLQHSLVSFVCLVTQKDSVHLREFIYNTVFGPEINDNNDSNDARVTASTSLKTITKAVISSSLVEEEAELFDSAPFKLFKAFWIAFFTTFLEAEYFLISLSRLTFLRMVD